MPISVPYADLKKAALDLQVYQDELRPLIQADFDASGLSLNKYAIECGIHFAELKAFLVGREVVCSERKAGSLCKRIGREDLYTCIKASASVLTDRQKALALQQPFVISLAVDILERYDAFATEKIRAYTYAQAFGQHAELIEKIFTFNSEAISRLEDAETYREVRTVLESDSLARNVLEALAIHDREYNALVDQMCALHAQLRPHFKDYKQISRSLGITDGMYRDAQLDAAAVRVRRLRGHLGLDYLRELIVKCQVLLQSLEAGTTPVLPPKKAKPKSSKPKPPRPKAQAPMLVPPSLEQITRAQQGASISALTGGTQDDIAYMLTLEDLDQIETDLLAELASATARAATVLRGLLNTASAMKDAKAKAYLQKRCESELIALEKSLKLFAQVHAGDLLKFYENPANPPTPRRRNPNG